MTATPSASLHVQTPKLGDIKPSAILPPSPLTPGSQISTMSFSLRPEDSNHQQSEASGSAAFVEDEEEDDHIIDISSPVTSHKDMNHDEDAPHLEKHVDGDYVEEAHKGGPSFPALLGADPIARHNLPPSPPLTVIDTREGVEGEASTSAAAATSLEQLQNVATSSPPTMQEEDITNWRASMGAGEETRREVLEEEDEGELEGDYDPYDLGYSPITPVSPSGPGGGEGSRTAAARQTTEHPLRFDISPPSPPPWEVISPPGNRNGAAEQSTKVFNIPRSTSRRPRIPHSAYYFGPPPLDAAYHTPPIGQIGVHHPRELIRVERDYSGGELVQFASTYPLELEGRITPTQFLETINAINECLISAHSLRWSAFDNALSFFTLQLSKLLLPSHYDKEMRRLQKLIEEINTTLYNPVGLNILWPRKVAFIFLEIEYY
ncbi:hypothetical protein BDW22DRAFT_1145030 [Trametopsis cervina]|nr:hypothetical protein BDW22DRAFT_1145030 [Trametopsis cervina]